MSGKQCLPEATGCVHIGTHRDSDACLGLAQVQARWIPRTDSEKGHWVLLLSKNTRQLISTGKEKVSFLQWVSLGRSITLQGRPHAQERPTQNKSHGFLVRFLFHFVCFVLECFFLVVFWLFVLIFVCLFLRKNMKLSRLRCEEDLGGDEGKDKTSNCIVWKII